MKIAVYVEGQTELIFVREFLLKWYDYNISRVGIRCFELRDVEPGHQTEYPFGDKNAERFYTIVNVGCDTRVLSKALDNASLCRNCGYDKVIALRDMYSDNYKSVQPNRAIDPAINARFITRAQKTISEKGFDDYVFCHFAIMEVEAWLLGMGWFLESIHPSLTKQSLSKHLNFNLDNDPETTEYHPETCLKKICKYVGSDYDKHAHEVNAIMSHISKADFEKLLTLDKCDSFKKFKENLTA